MYLNPIFQPVQTTEASAIVAQRPLKISIIASDLSNSGAGRWKGAVRPFLLAQAFQQLGHKVEILGFADEADALPSDADLPIKVITKASYPRFMSAAMSLMSQIEGDVVVAYKPKPSSLGIALMYKLRKKCPVILDIDDWELSWHGGDDYQYPGSLLQMAKDMVRSNGALRSPDHPLYLKWIERFTKKADAITLHTQFLQSRFGGAYVPNGKDVDMFDPSQYDPDASREKLNLSDYKVLMFPGAPRPYKGVEDILMALEKMNRSDCRLVIVGGSPYDQYDDELMSKWGKWIIKLPKATYEQMPEIVSAAHVIVVPQRDTPAAQAQFPLKLTDGMAMAKPILATRVGDIPEILGDTGYLTEAEAPDQMAEQLDTILQDLDAANKRGLSARQRCLDQYSISTMAARLQIVLQDLKVQQSDESRSWTLQSLTGA